MNNKYIIFFLVIICMCNSYANPVPALERDSADSDIIVMKEAVNRWLCWDKYWEWGPYELGRLIPIKVKSDGQTFYVWMDDLVVTGNVRMAAFYEGRLKDGQAAVILREAYSIGGKIVKKKKKKEGTYEKSGAPAIQGPSLLERRKNIFETGSVVYTNLLMPTDCTPHYDAPTKEKELMVETIVKTIKTHVTRNDSTTHAKRKLIIANFNIDYPSTYVLVEPENILYTVTLHDARDYDSHLFEKEGAYPVGVEQDPSPGLILKIKQNGIMQELNVNS